MREVSRRSSYDLTPAPPPAPKQGLAQPLSPRRAFSPAPKGPSPPPSAQPLDPQGSLRVGWPFLGWARPRPMAVQAGPLGPLIGWRSWPRMGQGAPFGPPAADLLVTSSTLQACSVPSPLSGFGKPVDLQSVAIALTPSEQSQNKPNGAHQKLILLSLGNAMSGPPTIKGNKKLPNPPINPGMTIKNIIRIAWAVMILL